MSYRNTSPTQIHSITELSGSNIYEADRPRSANVPQLLRDGARWAQANLIQHSPKFEGGKVDGKHNEKGPHEYGKKGPLVQASHYGDGDVTDAAGWRLSIPLKLETTLGRIHDECGTCTASGRSVISKKISFRYVNQALNIKIQAHFFTVNVHDGIFEFTNIVVLGTGYGKRIIATSPDTKRTKELLETSSVHGHGSLRVFNADPIL